MIRIAELTELQRILETLNPNAKKQVELIEWMIENEGKTFSAKNVFERTSIQPSILKAVIERGAAIEEYVGSVP